MSNLADRKVSLGASEVASLFGLNPYMTKFQLWHMKNGSYQPDDIGHVERVMAGTFLEPAIARFAEEKWGLNLRHVKRYIVHPEIPRMGASLDYETVKGLLPFEIKNVDGLVFRDKFEVEGDTIIRAPMNIVLQCQHQLSVTRKERVFLCACVAGNRLYKMQMEARPKTIEKIENAVRTFWQTIDANMEPEPDYLNDYDVIRSLNADIEGATIKDGDNYLNALCANYMAGCAKAKEGEAERKTALGEILEKVGPTETVYCDQFKIGSTRVRSTRVAYNRKPYRLTRITERKADAGSTTKAA